MKPLNSFDLRLVGVTGLVAVFSSLTLAYNLDSLPVVGLGPRYRAEFSEAAGMAAGNEVRIAGVSVGKITEVSLRGDHVEIAFRTKAYLGDASTASIEIKTILGAKFLAIAPAGDKPLDPETPIPRERTVTPYDVATAFENFSTTVRQLDTQQLAASLRALSDTFRDTAPEVRASLDGLSRLSTTIASRDAQLAHLLASTDKTAALLAGRNDDINRILSESTKMLDELHSRERAITQLLTGTRELSRELRGLLKDNEKEIGPALDRLDRLTDTLQRHVEDLVAATRKIGPLATVFGTSIGNGHWLDGYIDGLLPETPAQPGTATRVQPPTAPATSTGR